MSYTKTAKALHWLMAALLFGLLGIGFYMHDLPLSPEKLQLYSWHKWAGVTAFLLVAFRLFWRLAHRPPALRARRLRPRRWLATRAATTAARRGTNGRRPAKAGRPRHCAARPGFAHTPCRARRCSGQRP